MAWYRLYRPQRVSDIALTPIREYFDGLLKSGRYAHAYLFAGPKGVGKTSSARILARILNEPANEKSVLARKGSLQEPSDAPVLQKIAKGQSQVVIEQDAASHRGIDDIRALQEQISVVPSEGLIRVVILDEVHMLTTEAFNALLKMLEEPPERVIFVLATTELHKIPATVQSRCEILRFRQATPDEITTVLQNIAQQEKIKLSSADQEQLVLAAQGSFRDAVKYFEAVVANQQVDPQRLQQFTGSLDTSVQLLKLLAKKDLAAVSQFFQQARQEGLDFSMLEQTLFRQLQERLHRAIERGEAAVTIRHITQLLDHLAQRVGGYEPLTGLKLELACVEWCLPPDNASGKGETGSTSPTAAPTPAKSTEAAKKGKAAIPLAKDEVSVSTTPAAAQAQVATESSVASTPRLSRAKVEQAWSSLLLAVRTQSQSLESLLRNAQLGTVDESGIELQFDLAFHQEKLESPKYAGLFRQILQERFAAPIDFRCTVTVPIEEGATEASDNEDQLLQAVEAAVLALEDRGHTLPGQGTIEQPQV